MAVSLGIYITENGQNTAGNTSNVTVSVLAYWSYGSYNALGTSSGTITIDGKSYSFGGISYNTNQSTTGSQLIMLATVDVVHNDDGTKNLACSAAFDSRVSSGVVYASASKDLTKIERGAGYIDNGSSTDMYQAYIDPDGSGFCHYMPYSDNGTGWDMLG